MPPELLRHKRIPSFGECIYCGRRGSEVPLTDEHVVPYSLGGNVVIENASCEACAEITKNLEGVMARQVWWDFRIHAGVQTRRKKKRPLVLPATVSVNGGERFRKEFSVRDHPYFTPMPVWGLPGVLVGSPPAEKFLIEKAHVFYYVPPDIDRTLGLLHGQVAEIPFPQFRIDSYKFARGIAKIAYCQVVATQGLHNFRRLVTPALILGRYPYVPYFVGSGLSDPPPPTDAKVMHRIDIAVRSIGVMKLLVVAVRLFANSGTEENGPPIYYVVVGAPRG